MEVWLATGLGIGRIAPFAPGTFGSLLGLPLAWALRGVAPPAHVLALVALCGGAAWVAQRAERTLGHHDPSSIVIDEVCGVAITLAGHPLDAAGMALGFAAFRLLDIWKPWPIRALDRGVAGGLGTVLDDVAAGLGANLLLHLVARLL